MKVQLLRQFIQSACVIFCISMFFDYITGLAFGWQSQSKASRIFLAVAIGLYFVYLDYQEMIKDNA